MSLDDFESSYESADTGGKESGPQALQERIDKYQEKKEKSSKAMAGIQRTRKDEKKAQRDDYILARILEYFVKDRQYATIVDALVPIIDKGFSSNLIIGIISLVFTPAATLIREYFGKNKPSSQMVVLSGNERFMVDKSFDFSGPNFDDSLRLQELIEFNDHAIPAQVRQRINAWVEDIGVAISSDPSTILTRRILEFLDQGATEEVVFLMTQTLRFFMERINITMSEPKAKSYSIFILSQLQIKLRGLVLDEV